MLCKPSPHGAADISVELSFKAEEQIREKGSARIPASWVEVDSAKQPPLKQEHSGAAPKCKSPVCCVPTGLFWSWNLLWGMGGKDEGLEVVTLSADLGSLLQGLFFLLSLF